MSNRLRPMLFSMGTVLLCFDSLLCADTAAGMRVFRKQDYSTAYSEWKADAAQGKAEAQYNLGMLYLKGLGTPKDPEEAFRWLRLAADQGQAEAQFQVGL